MVNVSKAMKAAAKPLVAEVKRWKSHALTAEAEVERLREEVQMLRQERDRNASEVKRMIGIIAEYKRLEPMPVIIRSGFE